MSSSRDGFKFAMLFVYLFFWKLKTHFFRRDAHVVLLLSSTYWIIKTWLVFSLSKLDLIYSKMIHIFCCYKAFFDPKIETWEATLNKSIPGLDTYAVMAANSKKILMTMLRYNTLTYGICTYRYSWFRGKNRSVNPNFSYSNPTLF